MSNRGQYCETIALDHFLSCGFKCLGQRIQVVHVEVDLLLEKDNELYVVEVKSGIHNFEYLQSRVTPSQRLRLQRVVLYLSTKQQRAVHCHLCVVDDKSRVQIFEDWLCH